MRRLVGVITPDPDGTGSRLHREVRNSYDAAGRLVKVEQGIVGGITDGDWAGFVPQLVAETAYDLLDRKLREWSYGAGQPVTALTQYSYDLAGRLECTAVRMNAAAFASPPPSACTLGAEGGFGPDRITKLTYDAAGQLIKTTLAFGTPLQVDDETNTYTVNGKLASVTDGEGNRTGYTYDGFDRLARTAFPSPTTDGVTSGTDYEDYGYDANGNRISLRKRDLSVLTYQYDALNRMTAKIVPERGDLVATHTRDVHYGYDLRGLQLYARFDSPTGEGLTTAYDGLGRALSSTKTMDGQSRLLSYTHNISGVRTSLTYPDGWQATYGHDGLDRLTALREGASTTVRSFTYDARGNLAGSTAVGAGSSIRSFDPANRLLSLAHDIAGTTHDIGFTGMAYNPAGQLVGQTRSNDAYVYGGAVNVSRTYTTNGLNQYVATVSNGAGSANFSYDPNGNLTSDGATSYIYDIENRLVAASGANTAQLRYDPLGRLHEVGGGAVTTRFLYDNDELVAEYDPVGTLLRRYLHGSGSDDPVVWYEGSTATPATRRHLFADRQGSIIGTTDTNGTIIQINRYDEWGLPDAANAGRFGYTGQAWIPELGLWYYKARLYSPSLGRFMQTDPIGYEDGINWYAYVGNDPVNRVDPDGMQDRKLDRSSEQTGTRIARDSEPASDRSKYNDRDPNGADNKLSLDEANRHARYGEGKPVTVDASKLTVEVYADQESKTIEGRYGGQVQGPEKFVHGGVSVNYDPKSGSASIVSERYDFEQREVTTLRGFGRNIATSIGESRATQGGQYKIKPYTIHFSGQPKVIFVK